MKITLRAIAPLVAVAALLAGTARAEVIAGWDFSQYRSSASLTPFTDTLPANYSSLDPTHNAGAESAGFGTLYFDGSFGSSSTLTEFLPTAGSKNCQRAQDATPSPQGCANGNADGPVRSNWKEPWSSPGDTHFDAHSVLRHEGQAFQNRLGMAASSSLSVVFEADLSSTGDGGSDWSLSFGGRTAIGGGPAGGEQGCDPPGCTSTVGIDVSTNGSSYTSAGSAILTPEDTRFEVPLGIVGSVPTAYVRLNFDPGSGTPIIDNVALEVQALPEPGATAGLLAGGALLALLARRRRA